MGLFMLAASAVGLAFGSAPAPGFYPSPTLAGCDPGPVAQLAYEMGWRGDDLVTFVAIVGAESGFCPTALGDTYPIDGLLCPSHGWAQIRSCPGTPGGLDRGPRALLIDPRSNLAVAWRLWNSLLGKLHWSTWMNGRFRDYLPLARTVTAPYRSAT